MKKIKTIQFIESETFKTTALGFFDAGDVYFDYDVEHGDLLVYSTDNKLLFRADCANAMFLGFTAVYDFDPSIFDTPPASRTVYCYDPRIIVALNLRHCGFDWRSAGITPQRLIQEVFTPVPTIQESKDLLRKNGILIEDPASMWEQINPKGFAYLPEKAKKLIKETPNASETILSHVPENAKKIILE